ncbi:glycosyltransferase family 4 protein [Marinobacter nauticus]|uniref:glycosyltransferase family 4 protein n=1 Tax=Marinobacter nauticus TaxID=2743 RepID=UPI001C98FDEB|nr:glycosyltransferase family 4 protein [Marinobacter nauticus]MBY5937709.1 glycosyltransferase family 4 protein [Marinobacter nauticus]MBY5954937.1 glycosyltransferase family 4 protein [Marinobacter nauticus]MBY6008730.1 glycosyltransferase family 4 protein [Marinobacter nauticus]
MEDTAPYKQVILITRNFPPLIGGMEKLNFHLVKEISRSWRVTLIAPNGADQHLIANVIIKTCPSYAGRFLVCAASKVFRLGIAVRISNQEARPSVIIAGSGVSAPVAWLCSKLTGSPFGIYLHGLDVIASSQIYKKLFLPCIRRADFWMANSSATKKKASQAGIDASRIEIIHPGVCSQPDLISEEDLSVWRHSANLPSGKLLLSVGRLTKRKGLREFITKSLPEITKRDPSVQLIVVGSEPADALLGNSVGKLQLIEAANRAGVSDKLHFLGSLSDEDLSRLYQVCDVHIFPIISVPGDMEGFGMVAIESAAHGLPTVAFAEGGVIDAVNEGTSGYLIPPGDYTKFSEAVAQILEHRATKLSRQSAMQFASKFDWKTFGDKVRTLLLKEAYLEGRSQENR